MENIVRKRRNCLLQAISHIVFRSYISSVPQNAALCRNGLRVPSLSVCPD